MEDVKSRRFNSVKRMWEDKVNDVYSDTTIAQENNPAGFATGLSKSESSELNWPEDTSLMTGVSNKRRVTLGQKWEDALTDREGRPHPECDIGLPSIGGLKMFEKRMSKLEDVESDELTAEMVDWVNIRDIKQMWYRREATELMASDSERPCEPLSTEKDDDFESDEDTLSCSSQHSVCKDLNAQSNLVIPIIKINGKDTDDVDVLSGYDRPLEQNTDLHTNSTEPPSIHSLQTPSSITTCSDGAEKVHRGIFKSGSKFRKGMRVTFIGIDDDSEDEDVLCDLGVSKTDRLGDEEDVTESTEASPYRHEDVDEDYRTRTESDEELLHLDNSSTEGSVEHSQESDQCLEINATGGQDMDISTLIQQVLRECAPYETSPGAVDGDDGHTKQDDHTVDTEGPHCSHWIQPVTPGILEDVGIINMSVADEATPRKTVEDESGDSTDSDSPPKLDINDNPSGSDMDMVRFGRHIMVDEKDMIDRTEEMQLLEYQYSDLDSDGSDVDTCSFNLCDLSRDFTNGNEFLENIQPISRECAGNPNYFATLSYHAKGFVPTPNSCESVDNETAETEALPGTSDGVHGRGMRPSRKLPKTRTSTTRRKHPPNSRDSDCVEENEENARASKLILLIFPATVFVTSLMLWLIFPSGLPPAPRRIDLSTIIGHLIEFGVMMFK